MTRKLDDIAFSATDKIVAELKQMEKMDANGYEVRALLVRSIDTAVEKAFALGRADAAKGGTPAAKERLTEGQCTSVKKDILKHLRQIISETHTEYWVHEFTSQLEPRLMGILGDIRINWKESADAEPPSTPPPPVADQPPPKPSEGDVWLLVLEDMLARRRLGIERYGTPVQAGNGRKAVVDAYQELLDLAVYLRQEIEERKP